MADVYGNRWKNRGSLPGARGGQADIFLVEDLRGEYTNQCVLKRVRNPRRADRFRAEVLAGTRLRHANIMPVIDHSDLEKAGGGEPMYVVMPFAEAGPLIRRVKVYEDSIDSTIKVAKALAAGLQYAHTFNPFVIHRDLKPDNILFSAEDHIPKIADFGICLLADRPRVTDESEIVGSWAFMAPELERGGQLDVSPAADLYSLGKVIYFMISGGKILPRESHNEADFDLSARGLRHQALWMLLNRLICRLPNRIATAAEVLQTLEAIEDLGKRKIKLPDSVIQAVSAITTEDTKARNEDLLDQEIRDRREKEFASFSQAVAEWLTSRLEEVAKELSVAGTLAAEATVDNPVFSLITDRRLRPLGHGMLILKWSVTLNVRRATRPTVYSLIFLFARAYKVTVHTGPGRHREEDSAREGYIIPLCAQDGVVSLLERISVPSFNVRRGSVIPLGQLKLLLRLDATGWLLNRDKCDELLTDSLKAFMDVVRNGLHATGFVRLP